MSPSAALLGDTGALQQVPARGLCDKCVQTAGGSMAPQPGGNQGGAQGSSNKHVRGTLSTFSKIQKCIQKCACPGPACRAGQPGPRTTCFNVATTGATREEVQCVRSGRSRPILQEVLSKCSFSLNVEQKRSQEAVCGLRQRHTMNS